MLEKGNVFRSGHESQRPYNPGVPRDSDSPTREGVPSAPRQTADRPLKAGTLLGERYRVDSVLGYGGMGVVYRARDVKLDQDIALKRIRPDRSTGLQWVGVVDLGNAGLAVLEHDRVDGGFRGFLYLDGQVDRLSRVQRALPGTGHSTAPGMGLQFRRGAGGPEACTHPLRRDP